MDDSGRPAQDTTTHVLRIVNMHCEDCAALIDDTLLALPGVRDAHASLRSQTISVELTTADPEQVVAAVTGLGFRVSPPSAPAQPAQPKAGQQVSDAAWLVLEPVLRDRVPYRGRTVRDRRQLFEGIAYKHRTGVPWREVPATFGPWQTLYAKWARWCADGTWARLVAAAAGRDDLAGELAWLAAVTPAPPRRS